jgi:hypothetical protein
LRRKYGFPFDIITDEVRDNHATKETSLRRTS